LCTKVQEAVHAAHKVWIDDIILVQEGGMQRSLQGRLLTSSIRNAVVQGQFEALFRWSGEALKEYASQDFSKLRDHTTRPTLETVKYNYQKAYNLAKTPERLAQYGGVMPLTIFNSPAEVLMQRAIKQPTKMACTVLEDGEKESISWNYKDLDEYSRMVGAKLQAMGCVKGDRAVMLYPQTAHFIGAFFGCMYAGVTAVPAYPPHPARLARLLPRLIGILDDCTPRVILTTTEIANIADSLSEAVPQLKKLTIIATDALDRGISKSFKSTPLSKNDIAFLQYTSGSTSAPKGVMVSHFNLCYNLEIFRVSGEISEQEVGVSWLPVFHDLGLIGGVLAPVYIGFPLYLMSPEVFLQHPHNWLAAISKYRGTFSGGPNFAFDLVARRTTPEQRAKFDLSSWRIAFCGAEPVKMATINRFCEAFPSFPRTTYYPGYGLAESTLIIANSFVGSKPSHMLLKADALQSNRVVEAAEDDFAKSNVCSVVSQGFVWLENEIVIVDVNTNTEVPPMTVGELWVRGPTVCLGYWNNEEETKAFHAQLSNREVEGGWLRTGDLAFTTVNGEFFITGRSKDVIIVRGANYYPQDIEWAAEIHTSLRKGSAAAFHDPSRDQLTLVQEVEDSALDLDMSALCAAVARSVQDKVGLTLERVVLVKRGAIMKTSSGKIQRRGTRKALEDKDMEVILDWLNDTPLTRVASTSKPKGTAPVRKQLPALPPNDIAVIGMGVRLPRDISSPAALWAVLEKSQCLVAEVPADRGWERSRKFAGGFISDPFSFDAKAFGTTDEEAITWDPQHRLLLETVQDAIDDAGLPREVLKSKSCGVFIGISQREYDVELNRNGFHVDNSKSMASVRIAQAFGLQGPCHSVDTACSSSLVALHDAVNAIRSGECEVAIVGGVNLMFTPDVHIAFTRGGFLSPDGLCKTFDESANGYVRGEGVAVVVITKGNTAVSNNDRIYAVVKGTAINQDGRSNGLTAPNGTAQEAVIKAAIMNAGMRATDLQYMEAHGTGTALGDPIELNAIANAIGKERLMKREVTLGSIKTNIGHLESAAGLLGLMKVALSIHKRKLPASLHFTRPNPNAKFVARCIQQTLSDWPQPARPLFAGVSSFGFGGTNAHVILGSSPNCHETVVDTKETPMVLAVSAPTAEGLRDALHNTACVLQTIVDEESVAHLCLASTIRRSHYQHRAVVMGVNRDDLLLNLLQQQVTTIPSDPNCMCLSATVEPTVAKMFLAEPVFASAVQEVSKVVSTFDSKANVAASMTQAAPSPYAILAYHMGCRAICKAWGVTFEAFAGAGIGEVAAGVCSGLLTLEDAVAVTHVIATSNNISQLEATLQSRRFASPGGDTFAFISTADPSLPQFGSSIPVSHWSKVFTAKDKGASELVNAAEQNVFRAIGVGATAFTVGVSQTACAMYAAGVSIQWEAVLGVAKTFVAPHPDLPLSAYSRKELNALNTHAPGAGPVYASDNDFE
jgi:acyl-CoA synthetase (AMP-forming)/AMP-acid ligase II/3-oxoacyl-(acyl-carrier-protein) synthase